MVDLIRKTASATSGGELTDDTQAISGDKTFTGAIDASGGFTGTGGEATPTVAGLLKAPRVQRKERTSNFGGTGEITELTFNNLTIGQWYRSSGVIQISGTSASSTTHIELQTGSGTQISRLTFDGGTSGQHWNVAKWSFPFKATHATAKIQVSAFNATELTANGGKSLFHVIEDMPNHVETTDWT
jgi:hypothetical protein